MTRSNKPGKPKIALAAMERRLEREAPDAVAEMRPAASFEDVWENETRMKPSAAAARGTRVRPAAWTKAAAALLIAAGIAAGTGVYLNQETAGPDLSGFSTTDLTYQKSVGTGLAWYRGYEQIEQRKLSTPLNMTLEDQGVKLTLIDVYYDGDEARINYVVENPESDPALNEANASFNYKLSVEGAGPYDITEPARSKTFLDDHHFAGVISFQFEKNHGPAETTAKLNVTRLATHNGSWQADIPLSNRKSEALTRTFRPNTEFKLYGHKYIVNKIVAGPVSTWMTVKEVGRPDILPQNELNLQLYDDKGNWIMSKNSSLGQYEPFMSLNREPKSLTLQVTRMEKAIAGESKMAEEEFDGEFPVVMHGYGDDAITVTGIDFEQDRTIVKYKVNDPELQTATLTLTSADGKDYFSPTFAYRTSADKWEFESEYAPIAPDNLRKISAVVTADKAEDRSELTVKIPLDWSASESGTR